MYAIQLLKKKKKKRRKGNVNLSTHTSACFYYLKHVFLVVVTVTLLPCDVSVPWYVISIKMVMPVTYCRLVISIMYAVHSTQSILYNRYVCSTLYIYYS
jgi:hypothetical protein